MEPLQSNAAGSIEPIEPIEPCPTPLAWQEVVREVGEQSRPWRVTVDGIEVCGRTIGDGPAIYFLNGLLGDLNVFSLTTWLLREDFRCVVFDFPAGLRARSEDDLGQLLLEVASAQQDEVFAVFSTGFGCATAFAAMLAAPHRITQAILQGAFARCDLSWMERLAVRVGKHLPGRLRSIPGAMKILRQNHRPWFPPFDVSRWSFAEQNLGITPISRLASQAGLLRRFDFTQRCSQLTTPILLVRCEGDSPIQVAAQDGLESAIPAAGVEWLHTCGRMPFLTHPHRLKKLLAEFCGPGGQH